MADNPFPGADPEPGDKDKGRSGDKGNVPSENQPYQNRLDSILGQIKGFTEDEYPESLEGSERDELNRSKRRIAEGDSGTDPIKPQYNTSDLSSDETDKFKSSGSAGKLSRLDDTISKKIKEASASASAGSGTSSPDSAGPGGSKIPSPSPSAPSPVPSGEPKMSGGAAPLPGSKGASSNQPKNPLNTNKGTPQSDAGDIETDAKGGSPIDKVGKAAANKMRERNSKSQGLDPSKKRHSMENTQREATKAATKVAINALSAGAGDAVGDAAGEVVHEGVIIVTDRAKKAVAWGAGGMVATMFLGTMMMFGGATTTIVAGAVGAAGGCAMPIGDVRSSSGSDKDSSGKEQIQKGGVSVDSQDGEPAISDWEKIADCESGGNWSIDTGNGYYGGLQFDKQTWESVDGTEFAPTPDKATKEQQIEKALQLWRERGWSPWGCATSLGYTGGAGDWERPDGTPGDEVKSDTSSSATTESSPSSSVSPTTTADDNGDVEEIAYVNGQRVVEHDVKLVAKSDGDVLVVGDSLSVGFATPLKEKLGSRVEVDGKVGRPFSEGAAIIRSKSSLPASVVIELGTNNGASAAEFSSLVSDIKKKSPGTKVYVATVYGDRPWTDSTNSAIKGLSGVTIIDWKGAVDKDPSLIGNDGIHAAPSGYRSYANMISKAVDDGGSSDFNARDEGQERAAAGAGADLDSLEAAGVTLDKEQIEVSRTIIGVIEETDEIPEALKGRASVIALMTGMQEGQLKNIDFGDRDSLGVFQQRISIYPKEVATDVVESTKAFLGNNPKTAGKAGLIQVEGWENMPMGVAAQTVQISGYPDAYDKWEDMAKEIVATLSGDSSGSIASIAKSGCSTLPPCDTEGSTSSLSPSVEGEAGDGSEQTPADPDTTSYNPNWKSAATESFMSHLHPNTQDAARAIDARFGHHTYYGWRRADDGADHPKGLALDIMLEKTASNPAVPDSRGPGAEEYGEDMSKWLVTNRDSLNLKYLIWRGKYTDESMGWKWGPYGADMYGGATAANWTQMHMDHVHASFNDTGKFNPDLKEAPSGMNLDEGTGIPGVVGGGGESSDDKSLSSSEITQDCGEQQASLIESDGEYGPMTDMEKVIINDYYGSRGGSHRGMDIASLGSERVNLAAIHGGKIVEAVDGCPDPDGLGSSCGGGWGNHITIDFENGFSVRYAHLATLNVKLGDEIKKGESIGTMGSSGDSSGVHCHFEILNDEGARVNPRDILKKADMWKNFQSPDMERSANNPQESPDIV